MRLIIFLLFSMINGSFADCREECDRAFIYYVEYVCWIKQSYAEQSQPILNKECCNNYGSDQIIQCLENNGCFSSDTTWCDSWECDPSYQCDFVRECVNSLIQGDNDDIDCSFQQKCYESCPDDNNNNGLKIN